MALSPHDLRDYALAVYHQHKALRYAVAYGRRSKVHDYTTMPRLDVFSGPCIGGPYDGRQVTERRPWLQVANYEGPVMELAHPSPILPKTHLYEWSPFGVWRYRGTH